MDTDTMEDAVLLAARMSLPILDTDQAAFRDAFARLLDQAALVLAMPLPGDDAGSAAFQP